MFSRHNIFFLILLLTEILFNTYNCGFVNTVGRPGRFRRNGRRAAVGARRKIHKSRFEAFEEEYEPSNGKHQQK